jgi:L-asparaginase II
MNTFAILATVTRNGIVESTHLGDMVVCDVHGHIMSSAGDPERVCYYRSSGKPLQALSVVMSGAADQFALTETELAICCASHHGCRAHVLTVAGVLEKLGLDETALLCGVHEPSDTAERNRLIKAGEAPSPLHNNCSGKHAGMLATALALGAPAGNYLDLDHPVQRHIAANLALATGMPADQFHFAPDGCGAPVLAAPLSAMATSYARLANPANMPPDFAAAARRIGQAMATAPEMISAPRAFNSDLLDAGNGHLVAKGGAEGLMCVGIVDPRGLGLAVKAADGAFRALAPVTIALLRELGALSDAQVETLGSHARAPIANCHGVLVGAVEPSVHVTL